MNPVETDVTLSSLAIALDEELALLRELRNLSERQHAAVAVNDVDALDDSRARRDRAMTALLAAHARSVALRTAAERAGHGATAMAGIRSRQQDADALIREILTRDRQTVTAAQAANLAREQEVRALECGNATLAAYKRGLALATNPAAVVSQHA